MGLSSSWRVGHDVVHVWGQLDSQVARSNGSFLLAGSGLDVLIGLGLVSPSAMALRWFGCTQMGAV